MITITAEKTKQWFLVKVSKSILIARNINRHPHLDQGSEKIKESTIIITNRTSDVTCNKKFCSQIIFVWPADQWTDVEHCSRDCDPVSGQYQLRDLDTIIISCCMLLCHHILATLAIIEKENFLCQTAWTRKVYFSTKCGHCGYLSYLVTLIVKYLQQRQSSDGQISK